MFNIYYHVIDYKQKRLFKKKNKPLYIYSVILISTDSQQT